MCIAMATAPYEISVLTNQQQNSLAMSLFIFANALGGIVSPIILGWFHITAGTTTFLVIGISMAVISIVMLLIHFSQRVSKQCSINVAK